MTVNHPNELPPNYPEFVVCEGRYYLGHWFMDLPACAKIPQGGNVGALVWRYQSDAIPWYVSIGFRYYRDDKASHSADVKNWTFFRAQLPEAKMVERVEEVMQEMSGIAGLCFINTPPPIHRMIVQGDWLKFRSEVQRQNAFWLHT